MNKIILASNSPRRKNLLESIGVKFEVIPSNIDENLNFDNFSPERIAMTLANKKALNVANDMKSSLVIGADTIVTLDNIIYGKPNDDEEAYETLKILSGRTHKVITGVSVVDSLSKKQLTDFVVSDVKFSFLSNERINSYIKTGEHIDKAGSYAIQGRGSLFVEKILGCYFNIVGLPINKLDKMINTFNYKLL
ncbi:MAG: Maf family protein [Clostridiales bacterium]